MLCIYARCKREIPDGAQYCPWCGKKQTHEAKKKHHRRPSGTGAVYKNSSTRKRAKPWVALKNGHSIGQCFATEEEYPYLVGGEKTETGRDRMIPVISTILPYVRWFLDNATGALLFSAYAGNRDPKHWREREYYPLLDALGIPRHTPHGTRRTTASLAAKAKVDPAALQKVGGWKEFDTIQKHYNKPNLAYLYNEMEKLGKAHPENTAVPPNGG